MIERAETRERTDKGTAQAGKCAMVSAIGELLIDTAAIILSGITRKLAFCWAG